MSELCREIVADELERLDDDRLQLVTVTHVAVDPDLRHAVVEIAALGEDEEGATAALGRHRVRLQAAIARQARLKRTPELHFRVDRVIERAARIEEILASGGEGNLPAPNPPHGDAAAFGGDGRPTGQAGSGE